jgi:hypothetical protein
MVFIDPVTRQRVVCAKHVGDITYDLTGDDAISREDVPLIGPWTDWTGSNFNPIETDSRNLQLWAGHENELFGTDPHIQEGTKIPNLSVVGTRKGTHRRRIIKRYVEIGPDGKPTKFE